MGRSSCGSAQTSRFTCGSGKHHLQCGLVWKTTRTKALRAVLCPIEAKPLHAASPARLASADQGALQPLSMSWQTLTIHEISPTAEGWGKPLDLGTNHWAFTSIERVWIPKGATCFQRFQTRN